MSVEQADGLPISEKSKLSAEPTRKSFLPKSTPFVRLRTERDVKALAARTISQVRSGQLHYKLAQTIASLCNVALQAMKQGNEVALRLGAGKDNNYRIRKIIELEAAPSGDGLDGNKRDPDQVGVGLKLDARGGGVGGGK